MDKQVFDTICFFYFFILFLMKLTKTSNEYFKMKGVSVLQPPYSCGRFKGVMPYAGRLGYCQMTKAHSLCKAKIECKNICGTQFSRYLFSARSYTVN